jgi:hypothetical protein
MTCGHPCYPEDPQILQILILRLSLLISICHVKIERAKSGRAHGRTTKDHGLVAC